jgi:hypothetical protein
VRCRTASARWRCRKSEVLPRASNFGSSSAQLYEMQPTKTCGCPTLAVFKGGCFGSVVVPSGDLS